MTFTKRIQGLVGTGRLTLLLVAMLCTLSLPAQESRKLTGAPFGSPNYDYNTKRSSTTVNTPAHAFDGDFNTFYASMDRSYTWVGLDLGTPHVITAVGWCPRTNSATRVQLGLFEGSNREDFLDAVPLYLIPQGGTNKTMDHADVSVSRGFRYVRYVGPSDARCNIADLEFWGYEGEGDDSRFYQVTNLPTVSIHTYSGREITSKSYDQEANITITYDDGTHIQEYPILARGRGNASWNFPKKPYRIKFNDGKSHHMLKDSPLESPAKAKKWTLINNYGDKTLMRNILAFEMSRRLQMPYTPYCQPVDVLLNGEYKGCYQLCDQITVGKDRIDIADIEPEDNEAPEVTGGYLLEVDAYASQETSWFTSSRNIPVTIKAPDDEAITPAQKKYIREYFNIMESALWSSKYQDETEGYRSRLDVESFLKHFIVGEFAGNTDTYWSTYMYKDREEDRFTVSPCWDFDLAFENDTRTYPINSLTDWIFRTKGSAASGMTSFVNRVLNDPYASDLLKDTWERMRMKGGFTKEKLTAYVDSTARVLNASQRLNFIRWPIMNTKVHQNFKVWGSYQAEVENVKDYIANRIDWIDGKLEYTGGLEIVDSVCYIGTPEDLVAFSSVINNMKNDIKGYLTEDIDMADLSVEFTPIGSGKMPYRGHFDGQGHRIRNLNIKGTSGMGVFGVVGGGAVIENVILDKSCHIAGTSYIGFIGVSTGSGKIEVNKVGNEAVMEGTGSNVGGIMGRNMPTSMQVVITDCYNTGRISSGADKAAAICGWAGSGGTLRNCWNMGDIEGYVNRKEMADGTTKCYNCYNTIGTQATIVTPQQIASGELCHMLNNGRTEDAVWFQTLGEDMHPVFDGKHEFVYKLPQGTYGNEADYIDGIALTPPDERKPSVVYDLQGRPVPAAGITHGVYIIDRKKIMK